MKMGRRILAGVVALCMAAGMAASPVSMGEVRAESLVFGDYEYEVLSDGTVEITRYEGHDAELAIPEEIDGKRVTEIGYYAFKECQSLKKVSIPNSVISIGYYAFVECRRLINIVLPSNLINIEWGIFCGCECLTEISIPDGVTSIGNDAFYYCENLEKISIPDSVTNIEENAFFGCDSLKDIYYFGTKAQWDEIIISQRDKEDLRNTVIHYNSSISSGSSVQDYEYAVLSDGTIEITKYIGSASMAAIPAEIDGKKVTSIHSSVFLNNMSLEEVTIPDGVTSIANNNFHSCPKLRAIYVSEDNIEYLSEDGVLFNKDKTELINYPQGKKGAYSIPATVTSIGADAFSSTYNLTGITIPSSVSSIGYGAFFGCAKLTEIFIPSSVTDIGGYAFSHCGGLEKVTIPPEVSTISYCCFDECTNLAAVTIPVSVTKIADAAFYKCANLKDVYYYGSEAQWDKINIGKSGINGIDASINTNEPLFSAAKHYNSDPKLNFEYKTLSDDTIEITKYIGSGTVVEVPEMIDGKKVTAIGDMAFKNHEELTKVMLPDGITHIGYEAFRECTNLTEINISNSVISIGKFAFDRCEGLTEINIPASVTSIEGGTFYGCKNLRTVNILASITSIGESAFSGCMDLTEIFIPESVTDIGAFAFSNCQSLREISLSAGVTSLGKGAFMDTALAEIDIPNGVTEIRQSTFQACSNLKEVSIPVSVTSIELFAFNSCTSLAEIGIPASVTSISSAAFIRCSNLKDVYYSGTKEQWDKIEIGSINEELLNATIHYKDEPPQEEVTLPAITNPKQELEKLKSSGSLSLAQDFRHYLSEEQMDIVESCIYTWLADINYAYKYSGSSGIKEQIMKKAGIDPYGDFASGTEQAVTHISIKTNYGMKTFEITLDLGKPDSSGNLYPSYGAMHYEVLEKGHIPSDVPKSGQIGRNSYADMGSFIDSVSRAADESLRSTYQRHPLSDRMAAGVLIDKTAAEIIGNKNGAFSHGTFIVYAEPLFTYSKKVKATGPVNVYVYTMDGKEAGSSAGKKPDSGTKSVRIKEAVSGVDNQLDGRVRNARIKEESTGADSTNPNVRFDVTGNSTTVYLAGDDYYVNLRGTDTGTMTYEVEEIANDEVQRNVQFLELQLKKDMQYEGYVFRPLNIDKNLYALRTVDSSGQEVFYEGKDNQYQTLSLFKQIEVVTLSRGNASLDAAKTVQLSASLTPMDASNPNLLWSTDNASVAKVDGSGLVTAVGAGRATVTVSTKDGSFLKQFCVIDVADKNSGNGTGGNSSGGSSGSNGSSSGSSSGSNGSSGNSSGTDSEFKPSLEEEPAPAVVNLYYVLQFNLNGGTELSRRTMTLLADDIPGIMPKAKRKNYTFKGWYTQQEGGVRITGDKPLKEAATLYAQWTKTKAPAKAAVTAIKSKKKGQLQVDFKKISGAAGYQIEYSANKKFTSAKKKSAGASAKTKTITGLKAGKKYYVRVRAYSVDSMNNRIYGAYSAVKSVKIK